MLRFKVGSSVIWPFVVLLIAFGAFYLKPWQTKPAETISVNAMGKAQAIPNIAKISATIESKNPDLDAARRENEDKVANLITSLKALGIEATDIKTDYISGGPGYEAIPDSKPVQTLIYPYPPRPNTNQFTTTIEITIRDFNNSDEIMAALTQNGATNLYGPNLTVSDDALEEAKSKARENAVSSARKKGQELAKLSGRSIGKTIKVSEQGDYGIPIPIYAAGGEVDLLQKSASIQPGQNDVTINLLVDFSLK